jgi:hypothetical protein
VPWSLRFKRAPAPVIKGPDNTATPDRFVPPVRLTAPTAVPSWALGGIYQQLAINPFARIPLTQNYGLYRALREAVPIIDRGVMKTVYFTGCPTVKADDATAKEINAWLSTLAVNRVQTGFDNWLVNYLANMLTYGRAHSEIVLNANRSDVYGLLQIHPKTIALRPSIDRYSALIVQNQALAGAPVVLPQLLTLNAYHEMEGDDANGTSMLWSMPFVAEIMIKMTKALGNTWDRFGCPRYHVNLVPPDAFPDPTAAKSAAFMQGVANQFASGNQNAVEGQVQDFYSSGKVTVQVIGADGEALDFAAPMRVIEEQVVAATDIPPMAFGLSWSTTERMSAVQASLLTNRIAQIRSEVDEEIRYLIDLRQRLVGGDREFALDWPDATLMDTAETSRARFFDESGRASQIQNCDALWQRGIFSQFDVARELRPELARLSDDEIRKRLPKLAAAPPPPPAAPARGSEAGGEGSRLMMSDEELVAWKARRR